MNLRSQFSVQCPICHAEIAFYRVKRRFNCAKCATTLGSNRSTLDVVAALIYILLLPVVWFILYRQFSRVDAASYLEATILTAAVGVAAYCLLAPRLLWLETDSWHREAPPAPAGKKHKVLGYRTTARTGPHAGAKKHVS